jgi:autotransporter-associated beta strand protein
MSDMSMDNMSGGEHAWVHENLGAYLAGGLSAEERGRLDAHVNGCAECFDAFTEARDADRAAQRALAGLTPPGEGMTFEERIVTHTREATMSKWRHPLVRRMAYATAASVALAATGVFASFAMHQNSRFNNPFSQQLAAKAEEADPNYGDAMQRMRAGWWSDEKNRNTQSAAPRRKEAKLEIQSSANESVTPLPAATLPGINTTNTMNFRFVDARVDDVLDEMSKKFGFVIVKSQPIPTQVTMQVPDPVNAQQSINWLNTMLTSLGMQAIQSTTSSGPDAKTALRIVSLLEAKKSNIPVYEGNDPSKIPNTDQLITQIIPLKNIEAARIRTDLLPFISADADTSANTGSNTIVITDTAAKVRRLMEIVQKIDQPENGKSLASMNDDRYAEWTKAPSTVFPRAQREIVSSYYGRDDEKETLNRMRYNTGNGGSTSISSGNLSNGDRAIFGWGYAYDLPQDTGAATGAGTSTKSGTSTLTLSGISTYSGNTEINARPGIGSGYMKFAEVDRPQIVDTAGNAHVTEGRTIAMNGASLSAGNGSVPAPPALATNTGGKLAGAGAQDAALVSSDQKNSGTWEQQLKGVRNANGGESAGRSEPALKPADEVSRSVAVVGNLPAMETEVGAKKADEGKRDDVGFEYGAKDMQISTDAFGNTVAAGPIAQANGQSGAGTQSAGAQQPATMQAPRPQAVAQLKIIRNGTIEFEVRSFDDTYMTVARIVGDEGGFVSSTASEKLANGHVRGIIVVRVPPERLERFLISLRSLGELKAQQIAAADVTKQYTDTESELRGLRTMEGRLIELIKSGKGEVKDLVEAEKQLGEYRVRIEKLEGELSYYNNLVSLATITITAYEKDIAKPTAASEQESVNLSVETEEVESKYQAARKVLDDAKARIVESQLRNTDAEHVAAHIVADVPPDKADFVAGQLKTLGKVASFNRDRKQTTSGGTGVPSVQVEQKDTRITVDLFNLANLAPRETRVLRVAVPNVEAVYTEILGKIRATGGGEGGEEKGKPVGRVQASNLTGQVPEQKAADIRAEVRAENAADILAAIERSGEVLASTLATNADNASTTGAKRGIQLTLVNIANVPPKEYQTLNIAVRDVEKAYNDLLAAVRKDVSKDDAAENPLLPPAAGRVLSSSINGQQPGQKTADVTADVRSDKMAELLSLVQTAAGNEVMSNVVSESQEQVNFTRTKKRLQVRFIHVDTLAPREVRTQRLVAVSVPEAYRDLQASLGAMAAKGDVRVLNSNLNQNDARDVRATVVFEARRDALEQVERAFAHAGISFLAGNTARSSDVVNTLDSKVLFNIENLSSTDTLEPRRTITLAFEVEDVDKSLDTLRDSMRKFLPAGEGAGGTTAREIDFNVSREKGLPPSAHLILDVPKADSQKLSQAIYAMHGAEKASDVKKNSAVPDKDFARERYVLTITNRPTIIPQGEKSVANTFRAAITSALGALIFSLNLVVMGLLFILPFAVILWPVWAVLKRRKKAPANA